MNNRKNKRRLYQLWFQDNQRFRLTEEDHHWLNMAPVGREFGSADYERLMILDALHEGIKSSKIFIDTEFTDFKNPQLISIGLAAANGEEFYAEVPYLESTCSSFVKEVVIPLLGKTQGAACSKQELGERLLTWLGIVRSHDEMLEICFDFQTDWDLFANALGGSVPSWCQARLIGREINKLLRYDFHKRHQLPEHHALYDAQAMRYAFRERTPVSF